MSRTIGIIAAVNPDGIIGKDNAIPWHYPADLKRFRRLTIGKTVIMGRKTWESLPKRPLPKRRNLVVTSRLLNGVECFPSLSAALEVSDGDVWFIGGAGIYAEAIKHATCIDLTFVPDTVDGPGLVYFPEIPLGPWQAGQRHAHEDDPTLERQVFSR